MLKPNRIIFWTCLLYVCIPLVIQANNLTENCQPITQTERGTLVSQTFIKTILAQNINSLFPEKNQHKGCLLYTSPSPRDATLSRMPSSA